MLFERVESPGLSHFSYIVGDRREALVVDPRRDFWVYVDLAARTGHRITLVLETHRQEDFVLGSSELAHATGAAVWHADAELPYGYGEPAADGRSWKVGKLSVTAIATPGHTPGSMSYVLRDPSGDPWVVFSGDTLFAGDVGRVDLPGIPRVREMASLLHESLFKRILPLGDGVIVCPTHGAGSVCGTAIADRAWTSIGLEKRLNPALRHRERAAFVDAMARAHERPPYFAKMEELNLAGAPPLPRTPPPLAPKEFEERSRESVVVDTRSELAFSSAHVPGSLSIRSASLSSYAGWFVGYDRPVLLVTEGDDPRESALALARMGYDRVDGYLGGGMLAWHTAGLPSESVRTEPVSAICRLLDEGAEVTLLDVRGLDEAESDGRVDRAMQIPLTQLLERVGEVPLERPIHVFCGSGVRSTTAASLLARRGVRNVSVVLGGLAGWKSATCPVSRG